MACEIVEEGIFVAALVAEFFDIIGVDFVPPSTLSVTLNAPKDFYYYIKRKEYNVCRTGELVAYTGLFGKGKTLSAVHR